MLIAKAFKQIYGYELSITRSAESMTWMIRAVSSLSSGDYVYQQQHIDEHMVTVSVDAAGLFKSAILVVCEQMRQYVDEAEMEIEHQQAWEGTPV